MAVMRRLVAFFFVVIAGTLCAAGQLQGFEGVVLENVAVPRGDVATRHLRLSAGCREDPALIVLQDFSLALRKADAAVYVRVLRSGPIQSLQISDTDCVIGREHTARVLDAITMRPVRRTQLRWFSEKGTRLDGGGPATSEYVLLLRWAPRVKTYLNYGGEIYIFPVRGGRVTWRRTDVPGIRDGAPVSEVLEVLRTLDTSPAETRPTGAIQEFAQAWLRPGVSQLR
jgi:hypothetical protein